MDAAPHTRIGQVGRSRVLALGGFLTLLASVAALAMLAAPDETDAAGAVLRKATVEQRGKAITFDIKPGTEFALRRLERQPEFNRDSSRYLCVEMRRRGDRRSSRVCVGGRRDTRRFAGFARVGPTGKALRKSTMRVSLRGSSSSGLVLAFVPGLARVVPGRYAWRVVFSNGRCATSPASCRSTYPRSGFARYRVRPVTVAGCSGGNGQVVRNGSSRGGKVALTFDDGPSSYTSEVLRILARKKAKGTFFMLGDMVSADPSAARRVLAAGHEIGNHSSSHGLLPGFSDISHATRTIRRATGFRPCLFRAPYGAISSTLVSDVRELRMKNVLWNIDTVDWSTPGTGAIIARASAAGAGSIVLMHDGGGPRGQTVAALPEIISNLRSRGLRLVTVTKLLGNRFFYRPR
jgi:peptidoglycan/xylan/chitin deacetylase (PgdA/CDA1 family)